MEVDEVMIRNTFISGTLAVLLVLSANASASIPFDEWFDSYGMVSWDEERSHLNNLAAYLLQNPKSRAYLAYCGESLADLRLKKARSKHSREYLKAKYKISGTRLILMSGGSCDYSLTILQPVPKGEITPKFFRP